jgi:hypothetical protein
MAYFAVYTTYTDIEWRQMHSDVQFDLKHKIEIFKQDYIRRAHNRSVGAVKLLQLSSSIHCKCSAGIGTLKRNCSLIIEARHTL